MNNNNNKLEHSAISNDNIYNKVDSDEDNGNSNDKYDENDNAFNSNHNHDHTNGYYSNSHSIKFTKSTKLGRHNHSQNNSKFNNESLVTNFNKSSNHNHVRPSFASKRFLRVCTARNLDPGTMEEIYNPDEYVHLNFMKSSEGVSLELMGEDEVAKPLDIEKRRDFVLYPNDFVMNIWNIMILFSLAYLAFVLPITLVHPDLESPSNPIFFWCTNIVNTVFVVDIFINFFTAFTDDYNFVIDDFRGIAYNYLYSWFVVDFFSSIPFEEITTLLLGPDNNNSDLGFLGYLRYLKMVRVLKISRMTKIFKKIEYSEFYKNMQSEYGNFFNYTQRITKSTLVMLVCCHFFSQVLIYFYVQSENRVRYEGKPYQDNWVRVHYCSGTTTAERANCTEIDQLTYEEILVSAWYWAIQTVTTVGYGDIPSANSYDRLFRIVCILLGVYVFTDFVTSITYDMSDANADENSEQRFKLDSIRKKYRLSGQCSLYLELLMTKSKNIKMKEDYDLIEQLPKHKKNKVYENIYSTFCMKIALLREMGLEIFIQMFQHMKMIGKADTELIYKAGTQVEGYYMINAGKCTLHEVLLDKYKLYCRGFYKILEQGTIFGLTDCIFSGIYYNNVYCYESSELIYVSTHDLINLINKYDIYSSIEKYLEKTLYEVFLDKYATAILLKWCYEHRVLINKHDIIHYIINNDLRIEYDIFLANRSIPPARPRLYWWNRYLQGRFDHVVKTSAKKSVADVTLQFRKNLSRLKKGGNVIDHSLYLYLRDYYGGFKEDKQKESNLIHHMHSEEARRNYYDQERKSMQYIVRPKIDVENTQVDNESLESDSENKIIINSEIINKYFKPNLVNKFILKNIHEKGREYYNID